MRFVASISMIHLMYHLVALIKFMIIRLQDALDVLQITCKYPPICTSETKRGWLLSHVYRYADSDINHSHLDVIFRHRITPLRPSD